MNKEDQEELEHAVDDLRLALTSARTALEEIDAILFGEDADR